MGGGMEDLAQPNSLGGHLRGEVVRLCHPFLYYFEVSIKMGELDVLPFMNFHQQGGSLGLCHSFHSATNLSSNCKAKEWVGKRRALKVENKCVRVFTLEVSCK
eukprot:7598089-Ditylum_brightwellii.AAC.1